MQNLFVFKVTGKRTFRQLSVRGPIPPPRFLSWGCKGVDSQSGHTHSVKAPYCSPVYDLQHNPTIQDYVLSHPGRRGGEVTGNNASESILWKISIDVYECLGLFLHLWPQLCSRGDLIVYTSCIVLGWQNFKWYKYIPIRFKYSKYFSEFKKLSEISHRTLWSAVPYKSFIPSKF